MTNHIILCGQGKTGFSILQLLRGQGEDVVVIARDIDRDWEERAEELASQIIRRDARMKETLHLAGLATARAMIVATDNDLENLAIAIEAQRLAPDRRIVIRLYDETLARRVRQHVSTGCVFNAAELSAPAFVAAALGDDVLRAIDIDDARVTILRRRVTDEEAAAGCTLAAIAERSRCVPLAVYGAGGVARGAVTEDRVLAAGDEVVAATVSPASDQARDPAAAGVGARTPAARWVRAYKPPLTVLREAWGNAWVSMRVAFVAFNVILVASVLLYRHALGLSWVDATYFTISTLATVGYGDINLLRAPAYVKVFGCLTMLSGAGVFMVYFTMLTDYIVTRRFEQALGKPCTTLEDHFIVVGLGNIGHRVVARLHAMGLPVIAVERSRDTKYAVNLPESVPVLYGDASKHSTLEQAGGASARAVVAVTDEDVANFRVAHIAEDLRPGVRTVVRVFDTTLASKLGPSLLGIDRALSPSHAAAATFAAAALAPDTVHGFVIGTRLLILRRVRACDLPGCANLTLAEITRQTGIVALLHRREGSAALERPVPGDVIGQGDTLVVVEQYDRAHRSVAPAAVEMLADPEALDDLAPEDEGGAIHSMR